MADDHDDPKWGDWVAKRTFWVTAIFALLYVGSIFAFILYR